MSNWEDSYQTRISDLANRVDHDFTESDVDWSTETKHEVNDICNTFEHKTYRDVIYDLTEAKHHLMEIQREEDELRYGNLDEYGELIPPAGENS